jgi:hypothetical protein
MSMHYPATASATCELLQQFAMRHICNCRWWPYLHMCHVQCMQLFAYVSRTVHAAICMCVTYSACS